MKRPTCGAVFIEPGTSAAAGYTCNRDRGHQGRWHSERFYGRDALGKFKAVMKWRR